MAERNLSEAAERLLTASMQLFAENGYERTTVGEMQEAAGLTFGSGALYKHFPSKEAVLTTGIERFINHARAERSGLGALDQLEIPEAMTAIATMAMRSFDRDRDALRIAWRDLQAFPELQENVRTERIRATFDEFATWLNRQAEEGRVADHDSQAVAAVALSALAFFQLLKHLMGDTPAGVGEERFIATWTSLFVGALS